MNQKREEITRFLDHELLPQVKAAFAQYRPADKKAIKEKEDLFAKVKKNQQICKSSRRNIYYYFT